MEDNFKYIIVIVLLLCFIGFLTGAGWRLWQQYEELAQKKFPRLSASGYDQTSFINSDLRPDKDFFSDKKEQLAKDKEDFIVIDLDEMQLTLYEQGEVKQTHPVLSKGKEGSWWETPTGSYVVQNKEASHYSSLGNVWMPRSIKFYGNFYLHGWPYYPGGTPVRGDFSGGCIRLPEKASKAAFGFAKQGMPILVYDGEENSETYSSLVGNSELETPEVTADAVLIVALDSGEVVLNKKADSIKSVASLTKLMTAVVGSEVVGIGREAKVTEKMMQNAYHDTLQVGRYYKVLNLFYPLLRQSSNPAGEAIAATIGKDKFVKQMNKKADSLGMSKTNFADPTGISNNNTSTLKDIFRLANYILEKRRFLYDISLKEDYFVFGPTPLADLETFNIIAAEDNLVGAKVGYTTAARDVYASVWKFEKEGKSRYVFMGILGSEDREQDVKKLVDWMKENLEVTWEEE